MAPGRPLVVVLCKPPGAPDCKTRLARDLGAQRAAEVYGRCLRLAAGGAAATGHDVRFAVHGRPAGVVPAVGGAAPEAEFVRQRGPVFAARQGREIARGLADGYAAVVLLASDLATGPAEALAWTLAALGRVDVAVVPSADGGYSVLGSRRELPELDRVPMSREDTRDELVRALRAAGRSVAVADLVLPDVDEERDLPRQPTGTGRWSG